jgi:XRE family transcriptional regulator, master regulator for biofilm formation
MNKNDLKGEVTMLGRIIHKLRIEKGLSLTQLAESANVSKYQMDEEVVIDKEWIELIDSAIRNGITKEQFREFQTCIQFHQYQNQSPIQKTN